MPEQQLPWPRIESPLDEVNDAFHGSYDTARSAAEESAPVLILLADVLVIYRHGQRRELWVTPRLYHAIKAASHGPIALYSVLYLLGDRALDAATVRRLGSLREHTAASIHSLASDVPHAEAQAELQPLLMSTLLLIDKTLAEGRASRAGLAAFARSSGPVLLRLIDHATGVQLDALHARVEETLAEMTATEREGLQVVVAGPHQARERSVAMQYFRKRLREPAHGEERVAYAENVADEKAALALVGTRRFDRALAGAFFGDERRLQRDLLGDAAAARLSALQFPPAGPGASPEASPKASPEASDDLSSPARAAPDRSRG